MPYFVNLIKQKREQIVPFFKMVEMARLALASNIEITALSTYLLYCQLSSASVSIRTMPSKLFKFFPQKRSIPKKSSSQSITPVLINVSNYKTNGSALSSKSVILTIIVVYFKVSFVTSRSDMLILPFRTPSNLKHPHVYCNYKLFSQICKHLLMVFIKIARSISKMNFVFITFYCLQSKTIRKK